MAPIKQEEQIKDKLEQRTLQPTSRAWSQLAERLDKEEEKQNKSVFWWIGIAASIILLLAIAFPFLNNDTENNQPIIVNTEEEKIKDEVSKEKDLLEIFETQKDDVVAVENKTLEVKTYKKPEITKEETQQLQKEIVKSTVANETIAVVQKPSKSLDETKLEDLFVNTIKTFEEVKVLDVVAEIQKMKETPSGVSDREIDSLLKAAHKEIISQRLYNETTKTVNAELLLQDVEADLEQSFRSRVFDALKSNYNKVKTAVAERNN